MSELVPENMTTRGLEAFLHEKIPLTKAMGLHVAESNARRLVLEAPLAANRNHLGTAFGGSLHALPTLACYAGAAGRGQPAGRWWSQSEARGQAFYQPNIE